MRAGNKGADEMLGDGQTKSLSNAEERFSTLDRDSLSQKTSMCVASKDLVEHPRLFCAEEANQCRMKFVPFVV